jgi:hypothetical protein
LPLGVGTKVPAVLLVHRETGVEIPACTVFPIWLLTFFVAARSVIVAMIAVLILMRPGARGHEGDVTAARATFRRWRDPRTPSPPSFCPQPSLRGNCRDRDEHGASPGRCRDGHEIPALAAWGVCQQHSCPSADAIDLQPQDHPRLFCQVTRLLDDNIATARPVFRDIAQARLIAFACHEETTGRCPFPDDYAPHGNAQHIRSAPAARCFSSLSAPCGLALRSEDWMTRPQCRH